MKFDCGPTEKERWEAWYQEQLPKKEWHKWFAWRPVRIGSRDCRWLETVERRNAGWVTFPFWEYRSCVS